MRTILLGDVVAAARVLLALPDGRRAAAMDQMLDQAHVAHKVFKRLGRPHPGWGDGSLMSRALASPQCREPFVSDPRYISVLVAVLEALLRRIERRT